MDINIYKGIITDQIHIRLNQRRKDSVTSLVSIDFTVDREQAERLVDKLSHFIRESIEEERNE
jgi:cystathionine beta-lyase/cystathionine gamma-synthase